MGLLTVTASGVEVAGCPLTGVKVRVTVRVGVALRAGDGVTVLVAVRVAVGDGVRVDVAVRVSVDVAVRVRDAVGVREGVTVAVLVGVRVTVGDGVFEGVRVVASVKVGEGVRVAVGAFGDALVRGTGENAKATATTARIGATAMDRLGDMRPPVIPEVPVYQFVSDPSRRRM